jgi:hypothetical protein
VDALSDRSPVAVLPAARGRWKQEGGGELGDGDDPIYDGCESRRGGKDQPALGVRFMVAALPETAGKAARITRRRRNPSLTTASYLGKPIREWRERWVGEEKEKEPAIFTS